MAAIDINTPPRYNSASPRTQTSNLTSALQQASAHGDSQFAQDSNSNSNLGADEPRPSISGPSGRNESFSNAFGSYYGSGARPISVKDRPRRESNTGGGSYLGMSWGGLSVGSWINNDIAMQGTSPAMQSPSYHSSSYLPKMEANYMKDFTCCGLTLDSLHELLQHFEEAHAQAPGQTLPRTSMSGQGGLPQKPGAMPASSSRATQADPAAFTQHGFQTTPRPQTSQYNIARSQRLGSDGFNKTNLSTVQDLDNLEDMEMDDASTMPSINEQQQFGLQQQQQFNNLPQLNVNLANLQNNGLRSSNPNTPLATASPFGLQHNPTVSSVNTPTLSTAPLQQQSRTPDSSTPGTPAEFDPDFGMGMSGGLPMSGFNMNNQMGGMDMNFNMNNMNFGTGVNGAFDGTIDQPAKRLFSKNGSGVTQAQLAMAIRSAQGAGDVQLQNQLLAKMQGMQQQEEVKPFRCPVIGCEKAYKNQNGLKYHKTHGHQNQKLKENDNGTFSIVDPVTSVPYPGSMGMEKEKPYRCDFCGKRYKNLNGLKYHRQHSANCNPELHNQMGPLNGLQNLQGLNVNVAGAGLTGMDGSIF